MLPNSSDVNMIVEVNKNTTYLFKSNSVTLFPTGLNKQSPLLENTMFPFLYTVPRRFENY